jgi:DNA-binding NtrC family response regulator
MAVILVADDDSLIRSTMQKILTKAGHTVIEAATGLEAEEAFGRNPVDLLITDIIMPDKEGLMLVRDLKKRAPGLRIIAMSGGGRSGTSTLLEAATKFGAQAVLKKPFRVRELMEAVDTAIGVGIAPPAVQPQ